MQTVTETTDGAHQVLMDRAYDKRSGDMDYLGFLHELAPREREAVVLGHLNYQVENGGFGQWLHNGYAEGSEFLLRALDNVGTTAAKQASEMVREAWRVWNAADCAERNLSEEDEERLDEMSTEYYSFNAQLMADCEAYFRRAAS